MKQGAVVVAQNKALWLIYGLLLAALVFFLGYLTGVNRAVPEVLVCVEAPTEKQAAKLTEVDESPEVSGIVNINLADASQLDELPGIGPELAARIVAYRETYGFFVDISQIMDVQGIGEGKYAELEPWITVGGIQ